ncbi:YidC/Oxa1 family membrane protein insertase [Candidatus Peregrinibacteria bacterium]|jgi:YidC/Oxa1 family membrane protein insertase|nr:YidC/Oxa1 family membrane protein insertase [Candidatus Peregrinibacteria bacterium]MBT4148087.1 YidC/Oxa1 family membrane protein insertase [Candidatus Peregrinibacteria bacterium]MBT4365851.1 YidC/Oxa1 family membrane protein insertase [Candidatus Peregrinibacteria bacterium]MBT4456459.1 YidC/Oxa1 family membrane protein insertase [Candidatus Peregrinibacteria bacterium]
MNKQNLIKNILLFLIVFLSLNYIFNSCQSPEEQASIIDQGDLGFMTTDTSYSRNKLVTVEIKNNTTQEIVIPQDCPGEPFDVFNYDNGEWVQIESTPEIDCSKAESYALQPGEELKVPYDKWSHALFSKMGRFRISFTTTIGEELKTFDTNEFIVEKEGMLSQLWNGLFYRPIYNALIFFIHVLPGNSLGLAIILLTILIRTILLAPSQKAMKAQRRMQEVQPMIEKIKEKYKGDQQRISQETMTLWKTQKVNPMGSCLPLLLQFPVLIALFWVVKGGLNPDNSYLLYTTYENFSLLNIDTAFLGLDLLKPNVYVLPVIIGLLQFGQMKLSMHKKGKKTAAKKEMAMANNMMMYAMPVMIAVFTASLPAGVGVYWGTSTLYGIIQQVFVNKGFDKPGKKDKPDDKNSDDVKVRVIEKH